MRVFKWVIGWRYLLRDVVGWLARTWTGNSLPSTGTDPASQPYIEIRRASGWRRGRARAFDTGNAWRDLGLHLSENEGVIGGIRKRSHGWNFRLSGLLPDISIGRILKMWWASRWYKRVMALYWKSADFVHWRRLGGDGQSMVDLGITRDWPHR